MAITTVMESRLASMSLARRLAREQRIARIEKDRIIRGMVQQDRRPVGAVIGC
jgi:hypothetical protein